MTGHEWGQTLPTLSASRLDLRWLTREDAPALLTIFGDDAVTKFWSSPSLPDLAAATALLDEIHRLFAARTLFQWGICPRETGQVIGT
ncbi:MAG: GNAT family N-acetyltransferase, partial [Gammaproteobacteria bacterium]